MPALSNDLYESILRDQAKKNLERLSAFEPPPTPPQPHLESPSSHQVHKTEIQKVTWAVTSSLNQTTKPSGIWSTLRLWVAKVFATWVGEFAGILGAPRILDFGLTLKLFTRWSEDNIDAIDAAKQRQVFGGKSDINWETTFLPFMESIGMYLRDVQAHKDAWVKYRTFKDGGRKGLASEAIDLYVAAHSEIDKLAQVWGMRFPPICDLCDLSPNGQPRFDGPYCGMFFTTEHQSDKPFIGVAFKGTSPINLKEWAVDFNYQLTPTAQEYFGGTQAPVSQGVYTSLFGSYPGKGVPYQQILKATRFAASKLPNTSAMAVPLHVTGHSLGGSYSTLCYTQLLIDVAPSNPTAGQLMMGDEYTFGAPRIGSNEWAGLSTTLVNVQRGRSWRIVNNHDLVPQVPPTTLQRKQRDFHHVDTGVHIWPYKGPQQTPSEIDKPNPKCYPIYSLLYLIPSLIMVLDHRKSWRPMKDKHASFF
ncbi:hypothetical protein KVR01_000190 [Diaporthe batatas]|uniref:uncharacterized protein n=1 Tax=Diaporthe batatas TaxID=748121 RepID=UPI001D03FA3A|nr:uncharacterized protein KVR01_000190 [Diaporthe batatas]KAG8169445.1 hypothetical protein KVR01_000190 [Diaporthe batatas]